MICSIFTYPNTLNLILAGVLQGIKPISIWAEIYVIETSVVFKALENLVSCPLTYFCFANIQSSHLRLILDDFSQ